MRVQVPASQMVPMVEYVFTNQGPEGMSGLRFVLSIAENVLAPGLKEGEHDVLIEATVAMAYGDGVKFKPVVFHSSDVVEVWSTAYARKA